MIGFTAPSLLALFAPVAGLLLYAYIFKGTGTKKIISSTLLVKDLSKKISSRKKIQLPIRFFIEAIILGLLVGLIAGLNLSVNSKTVGIILDNSQSTGTLEARGKTLFDGLKEQLEGYIDDLPEGSTVYFRTAQNQSWIAERYTIDQTRNLIEDLGVTLTRDDISTAFDEMASLKLDEIAIFSDKKPEGITPSKVKTISSDSSQSVFQNVAIADATFNTEASQASVELRSSSARNIEVQVELAELSINGKLANNISSNKIIVPAGGMVKSVLPINGSTSKFLKATLRFEPGFVDALISDNEWFYYLDNGGGPKIVVVSDLSAEELRLKNIHGYDIKRISPKEYIESKSRDWDVSIFHKWVPSFEVSESAVYIDPTNSNPDVERRTVEAANKLTRWDEASPILSYLNLSLLDFPTLTVISPKDYQRPFMYSEAGSVAVMGQKEARRVTVLGFELFPFEGKTSPAMSILCLNLLKWIGREGGVNSQETHFLENLVNLNGSVFVNSNGIPRGIYKTRDEVSSKWYADNFFDAAESIEKAPYSISSPQAWDSNVSISNNGYFRSLIILVLMISVIDLFFTIFSKTVMGIK